MEHCSLMCIEESRRIIGESVLGAEEKEDEEKEDEELVAIVKDIDSDGTEIIKKLSGIAESLHTKNLSEQLSR
ncbi:hypothetical protein ADUPG1_000603 [Aduncisulcus paluster]|uniref:Uncharacterized protein n=1 Tax=Aduncisulcus paluster TaxID=2918883 RepID=A0ABQ5KAY5_9EUKA|nr:hypothetical protein ADUPG1_000603 [Aduncisulcus paluster]